ncbi:hypothetical protein NPIL_531761 [Nephila pilipes]|uniref:Uncharacterized protein n=1 Tax=Nephila pilipes TaxID=299642 RepID=A0A8X6QHT6_NEPPI|nr:hypothetical protein NPIL_531761 [Nephila pilipes]
MSNSWRNTSDLLESGLSFLIKGLFRYPYFRKVTAEIINDGTEWSRKGSFGVEAASDEIKTDKARINTLARSDENSSLDLLDCVSVGSQPNLQRLRIILIEDKHLKSASKQ